MDSSEHTLTPSLVPETPISSPAPGFRIDQYTITDILGRGAMASVYLATDSTGHEVALKVFQEGPGVSATMLERFRREAEASKKLRRHPNIMTIYATGKSGPYHYIVMESIRNSRTLERALASEPFSISQIVSIGIRIARALHYAHQHNIIHRDVKPSNILLDEFGEPLLSDFGVAELIDWPSVTATGALTGTPLYMSPEQARGERVGPASDVYSLAVVLYEALTGVLPYSVQHGSPVQSVLEAVRTELPPRPRLYRAEISPALEAVLLKALEKDVRHRYADAESFAVDLERAQAGYPVSAKAVKSWLPVRYWLRRYRWHLRAAAIGLLLLSALGAAFRRAWLQVHYRELVFRAQLQSVLHSREVPRGGLPPEGEISPAWQPIREARKAILAGDWATARELFQNAGAVAQARQDPRIASIAALEEARCLLMMRKEDEAAALYTHIVDSPEAPKTVAEFAQLESVELALLRNQRDLAVEILKRRPAPAKGPVHTMLRVLSADLPVRAFAQQIGELPLALRNDAYLAAALRAYLDGEPKLAAAFLREARAVPLPFVDWPSPWIRELREEWRP